MITPNASSSSRLTHYLQVNSDDEGGGGDNSKWLVVRGGLPILAHGLQERSIGNEEDDERGEDAMAQTDEEVLVVEEGPLLAW